MATPRRLVVVLFYQGTPVEALLSALTEEIRGHVDFRDSVELLLVKRERQNGSGSILSRLTKLIQRADAAIALITEDRRYASEAGNLWHEIALWYAFKRTPGEEHGESILLLQHVNRERPATKKWRVSLIWESLPLLRHFNRERPTKRRWPVGLISNLSETLATGFESTDQALKEVTTFLYHRLQVAASRSPGASVDATRVAAHFGRLKPSWNDSLRTHCRTADAACEFRAESNRTIAELLQMLDAHRRMADVSACLARISHQCREVIRTLRESSENRQLAMKMLDNELARLRSITCSRVNRESEGDQSPSDTDLRRDLAPYLRQNLRASSDFIPDAPHARDARTVEDEVDPFCLWAQTFLTLSYRVSSLYLDGLPRDPDGKPQDDPYALEIQKHGGNARDIADGIDALASMYYKACLQALEAALGTSHQSPDPLTEMLCQLIRTLPHNDAGVPFDIWRGSATQ